VATQDVFSAEELARLRGFPEINRAELIRYFTLTGADEAFVRQFRTVRNVLGVAVQLCAEWYFRPETLEAANAAVVNHHHRLPLTRAFGSGTLSSSDGQRFPVKGKSITARHLSRYFARAKASLPTRTSPTSTRPSIRR
jgi:TnpA family transposase